MRKWLLKYGFDLFVYVMVAMILFAVIFPHVWEVLND